MENIIFDGQQTGERILYTITPHPFSKNITIVRNVFLAVFFYVIIIGIADITPAWLSESIQIFGFITSLVFLGTSIWWNHISYTRDISYITDRRIIRFDQVSPFIRTKRELFWGETLKAKGFAPNLLYRTMNIGILEINPVMGDGENVRISNVYYFEDLANYIDKILYTFKNQSQEMINIAPFKTKAKGKRDE
jgi:hypothetical protein